MKSKAGLAVHFDLPSASTGIANDSPGSSQNHNRSPSDSAIPSSPIDDTSSSASSDLDDSSAASTTPSKAPAPHFHATHKFLIRAHGKALWDLPTPGSTAPIPVFDVSDGRTPGPDTVPLYISARSAERARTIILIEPREGNNARVAARMVYTFAIARTPKIEIVHNEQLSAHERASLDASRTSPSLEDRPESPGSASPPGSPRGEGALPSPPGSPAAKHTVLVQAKKLLHRSTVMRTHLGTFEWRYADKKERQRVAPGSDSLMVLEKVAHVVSDGGRKSDLRVPVGHMIRSQDTRTPDTKSSTAGNGGLLVLDLGEYTDKTEFEEMRVLAVSSCLVMLKKEVDRRRQHQIMVLSGGAVVVI